MFAAPPMVETEIFASLPEELRIRNRTTELSRFLRGNFDSYLDGTSFDRLGNLYCVDVLFGRIFRVDLQGTFHVVAEYDGEPSGLAIHKDGRLFVADRRHGIIVISPPDSRIEHVVQRFDREAFRGLCDLTFSADGDLYFTDQGNSDLTHRTGRIFRLCADGRLDLLLDDLPAPCGIGLDLAGRVLYASLTRDNSIIKVPLLADGRPSRVLKFLQLSGGGGPDGIAVDNEGGVAVAHPVIAAVWLFDWRGQPTLRVNLCRGRHCTNVAYGGPGGRRLYITEAETGTIQFANMPVSGVPKFSHLANP